LKDRSDDDAWGQFVELYGPMMFRFVRSRGLQDADAADLVQEVLRRVGDSVGRLDYAKEKGGFRAWLFTITRNCLNTHFEQKKRIQPTGNDTAQLELLQQVPNENETLTQLWELEYQRQLMSRAIEIVKPTIEPKTWSAFEMTAIQELTAEQAGEKIRMSRGAVYVARSRVTAKLRAEVERMMDEE